MLTVRDSSGEISEGTEKQAQLLTGPAAPQKGMQARRALQKKAKVYASFNWSRPLFEKKSWVQGSIAMKQWRLAMKCASEERFMVPLTNEAFVLAIIRSQTAMRGKHEAMADAVKSYINKGLAYRSYDVFTVSQEDVIKDGTLSRLLDNSQLPLLVSSNAAGPLPRWITSENYAGLLRDNRVNLEVFDAGRGPTAANPRKSSVDEFERYIVNQNTPNAPLNYLGLENLTGRVLTPEFLRPDILINKIHRKYGREEQFEEFFLASTPYTVSQFHADRMGLCTFTIVLEGTKDWCFGFGSPEAVCEDFDKFGTFQVGPDQKFHRARLQADNSGW